MFAVADEIEFGFELLGASAIEDKLQVGVADTIHGVKMNRCTCEGSRYYSWCEDE